MAERRSLVQRVLGVIAGGFLSLAGIVLVIPLPEAGLPLLLVGLRLLAWQFEWAQTANKWVDAKAKVAHQHFISQPLAVRIVSTIFGLAVAIFVLWWLVSHL